MVIRIKHIKSIHRLELGFILALTILIPFMFITVPIWFHTPAGRVFLDFGHIVFFSIVTFLAYRWLPFTAWLKSLMILLAVFFGGVAIEVIQEWIGRDASWADVFKNMLGATFILAWVNQPSIPLWIGRVIFTAVVVLQATNIAIIVIRQDSVFQSFPLISSFESHFDYDRWKAIADRVEAFATHGKYSMRVKLREKRYSRLEISYFPPDWTQYKKLCFDIYNPNEAQIPLTIRVNDYRHIRGSSDRYQEPLIINPQWNYNCIPLKEIQTGPENRKMDMHEIKRIVVFGYRLPAAYTIYTDNWRLE